MFSDPEHISIDYHRGSRQNIPGETAPVDVRERDANILLLSSYITVRDNCEEACSNTLLNELPDDEKTLYRNNSRIGQNNKKEIMNFTSKNLDACIRRCFAKRMVNIYGEELKDHIFQSAYEFDQKEIIHYILNKFELKPFNRHLNHKDISVTNKVFTTFI